MLGSVSVFNGGNSMTLNSKIVISGQRFTAPYRKVNKICDNPQPRKKIVSPEERRKQTELACEKLLIALGFN